LKDAIFGKLICTFVQKCRLHHSKRDFKCSWALHYTFFDFIFSSYSTLLLLFLAT